MSNHYFLYLYVLGMDARTMLNGVTYTKSLRLSNKARQVRQSAAVAASLVLQRVGGTEYRKGVGDSHAARLKRLSPFAFVDNLPRWALTIAMRS